MPAIATSLAGLEPFSDSDVDMGESNGPDSELACSEQTEVKGDDADAQLGQYDELAARYQCRYQSRNAWAINAGAKPPAPDVLELEPQETVDDLKQAYSWPQSNLDRLETLYSDFLNGNRPSMDSPCVMMDIETEDPVARQVTQRMSEGSYSTAFTGIDACGTALESLAAHLQQRLNLANAPKMVHFSAVEMNSHAQQDFA